MADTPIILIDGSSYFFRAFHALPPLHNSKGYPTGAIYGVINMIRRIINDYQPKQIAIIFDSRGKTFRDELYNEYKANRETMPDDLSRQFKPMLEIIENMGLPLLIIEGVEADDVIGTLAHQASEEGLDTIISTGDKDMAQLVDAHVKLINTMTNTSMDRNGVIEKFGVPPERIIDYLSLIGDKVDNIPGIPNVGPKTAAKWLETYGDLEGVIAHADEIKGKVGENLRENLHQLPLARKLVTIKRDIAFDFKPSELTIKTSNKEKLIELFKELEFRSWLNDLLSEAGEVNKNHHYETILTKDDFAKWIKKIKEAELFAFDTETTSLDPLKANLVGMSFAVKSGEAAYIPLMHDYENAPTQLNKIDVLSELKSILENPEKKMIAQNLKYDMQIMANESICIQANAYDTMLESYILNSGTSRHDMDSLALKYLGRRTIHYEDVAGKGSKQKTFNQITIEEATPYAAEDADVAFQLHEKLWSLLEKEKGLKNTFETIEMPLVPVLSRMERVGVLIDCHALKQQSIELEKEIAVIEKQAYQLAGKVFNLASSKQIQTILFEEMKLPVLQKTPKGQPSTAESALTELALDYPLPKLIVRHRVLSKLKSTYTDSLPEKVNSATGRIHTSYNQAVASTGRLSSTDPNLQNIPVRTSEGRRIRQAFIAPPGYKIISSDYSQIELRIMAHLTNDPGLTKAFANGLDIHRATAAEVFGISLDEVTNEQRRTAKVINFGLIYGMSAFGLAKQLDLSREAAHSYIERYFQRYPSIKNYMDSTREKARKIGYVETIFGRRLYVPEINSQNHQRQKAAERTAINAPMQGSAADIIKLAMINMDHYLQSKSIDARMIMQVHDELVFEVADNLVPEMIEEIKKQMCQAAELSVPLQVDIGYGDNWDEAH